MIGFLTIVTVIYALILVAVVAATLVFVGRTLWRIGTTLGGIAGGLAVVESQTAPLAGYVDALNDGLGSVARDLASTAGHLSAADDELGIALGDPVPDRSAANVA